MKKKEKEALIAINESYPKIPVKDIIRLMDIADKLLVINTNYCNRDLTNTELNRKEILQEEAYEIANKNNISININSDPRGFQIMVNGTKRSNSFIGNGWGLG